MHAACLGARVISQHCCRQDALWPLFHWFLPFIFWFLPISILLPVDKWASWLSPWPFGRTILWGAHRRIHYCCRIWLGWRRSSLPRWAPFFVRRRFHSSRVCAESFSRDDLLALVRNEFTQLMQQQQANPSLSVSLAPPG